jgi:hypothetical protein
MLPPHAAQLPSPPLRPTARPRVAQELATRLPHLLAPPALAAQCHTPRPPGQLSPARPQPMPPMLPRPSRTTRMSPCGQVAQPPPKPCSSSQSISFSSCRAHVASPSLKQPVPTTPRTPSACASSSLPYFISLVANTPSGGAGVELALPSRRSRQRRPCRSLVVCTSSSIPLPLRGLLADRPAWQPRHGLPGVACATCPSQPWRSLCGVAAASLSLVLYVVHATRRRLASLSAIVAR